MHTFQNKKRGLSESLQRVITVSQDLLAFTEADIKDLGVKNSAHRARVVSSLVALRTKHEQGNDSSDDFMYVIPLLWLLDQ
jgi:hypothetical protein